MIQIQNTNIQKSILKHKNSIFPHSNGRLKFCISFFEAITLTKKIDNSITKIESEYGISPLSAISFVKKYIKNKKNHKNVNQISILNFLKRKDTSLVSISNRKLEFRNILNSLRFLESNLKTILQLEPSYFDQVNKNFKSSYKPQYEKSVKNVLEFILPYEILTGNGFSYSNGNWNNYSITKSIGLQTCPFCNRSWISTVTEGKTKQNVINPQLDHFYPQSIYPLFCLTFLNLIPSCEPCNSRLKRQTNFDDSYLNPYVDGYKDNAKFIAIAKDVQSSIGMGPNFKIFLSTPKKMANNSLIERIKKNHDLFEINKIYESHGDIISEIYRKSYLSNNHYLNILKKQFPELSGNKPELYRMAIGNFYNESDFKKRPFAKLTRDVAEQIGLI